jgi:myo-inositol-hexaphosphate 3-phosphohydrolase
MNKSSHISLPWLLLPILCISIVVTGLILVAGAPRQSVSTPSATKTPTSTDATTSALTDLTEMRPYASTSPWNTPSRTVTAQPDFEVNGQGRNADVASFTHLAPFGTVIVQPDFQVSGRGKNIDSIAFWEAPDARDTLIFVTAKNNQLVEVWKYPFVDNEESPLKHNSFGSSSQVNGLVVDQENDLLYVSVSKPASTVSVFSVPQLKFKREFIEGSVDLKNEPNITLLKQADGKAWAYVSADNVVYIHDAYTGAKTGQFKPSKGLETLVADNFYQVIYIPDENGRTGVYAYHADGTRYKRNSTNKFGAEVFQSDAEGILLYSCLSKKGSDNGNGFIIVADQKNDQTDFEFFNRQTWEHLGTVQINGVFGTDGIASTQRSLPEYPLGIFAAINNDTSTAGVGWDKIFDATGLSCEQGES